MTVEIASRQRKLRVPRKKITEILRDVLSGQTGRDGDISVAIVDNRTIRALNRQFLHRDRVTDVIAFPLEDDPGRAAGHPLGEVVVSAERALQAARRRGGSPQAELLLYVVHGVLHLLGMADDTPARASRMHHEALKILRRHSVRRVT